MISKFSAVDISLHRITAVPELVLSGDILNTLVSLCLSQISLVSPFKFDIKEEREEEEEQFSRVNKKLLLFLH